MNKELRFQNLGEHKLRSIEGEDGKRYIEGYAILFNQRSKLIFENGEVFYEHIERSALDGLLQRKEELDVLYTYQHNISSPMARYNPEKGVENLTFEADDIGLKFRAEVPNTTLGNDTYELVRSGVLYETSFIFTVDSKGQRWERDEDGNLLRFISRFTGLYDISTVVNAAYDGTSSKVARADFEELIPKEEAKEDETKTITEEQRLRNDITLKVHTLRG
jgi:HK97 family phage prohead protease